MVVMRLLLNGSDLDSVLSSDESVEFDFIQGFEKYIIKSCWMYENKLF